MASWLCFFTIIQFAFSIAQSKVINIGGLFTNALVDSLDSGKDEIRAARLAIQEINNSTNLLPNHTARLIARDDLGSGWGGLRALCNLTREGIHGIVGPGWSSVSTMVGKACSAKHIPAISYSATSATLSDRENFPFFSRVVAPDTMQASAMMAAVKHFTWNRICILHRDDNYGIQGALATTDAAKVRGIKVLVTKSFNHETENATQAVTEAVKSGCRIFVLWCIRCEKAMHSILNVGNPLLIDRTKYAWIMSDGCSGSVTEYSKYSGLKEAVIGTMCVSPYIPESAAKSKFRRVWDVQTHGQPSEYALFVYDAVLALAHAINRSNIPAEFKIGADAKCLENPMDASNLWPHGKRVRDELLNVAFEGTTSGGEELRLSSNFERATAVYTISNLQGFTVPSGGKLVTNVAVAKANVSATGDVSIIFEGSIQWNSDKIKFASRPPDNFHFSSRTIKVMTISGGMPFNDVDTSNIKCENWERTCPKFEGEFGPYYKCPIECYIGLAIDVLNYVSSVDELNFYYEAYHTKSGYGYTPTIRQALIKGNFDFIVGDFTATSERSEFVTMSYPYYDLGLQMVMLKENPTRASDSVVMLFSPFTPVVWGFLGLYVVFASFLFWVFEHGNNQHIPDWQCSASVVTPKQLQLEPKRRGSFIGGVKTDHMRSGVLNSIYWGITSFTLAPDIKPVTRAGKIMAAGYMFCNVLLLAIYTSVLASYLTIKRVPPEEFNGIDDIGPSKAINFEDVCLSNTNGSIEMFWNIKFPGEHRQCYNCGQEGWNHEMCYDLLQKGKVKAIIGDSPVMQYNVQNRWCDSETRGALFYLQGFSLMGRKDDPLVSTLAPAILRARESQYVEMLQNRYFNDNMKCPVGSLEEEPVTEGVQLVELSTLWFTFLSVCVVSIAHFIFEQKRGFDELRRQKNLVDPECSQEDANDTSTDNEAEEARNVFVQDYTEQEGISEEGKAITHETNDSPKQVVV